MRPTVSAAQLRVVVAVFAVLFILVVASGWVPGWYTMHGTERRLFGLFMMSALDDITHGVSALALAAAALRGRESELRLVCTALGWYYALDALFFLLYGFVNEKPWPADLALNAPHVAISVVLLTLAYAPRAAAAPARAPIAVAQ
ncbi:hypothetical protein [Roseisolibacter sp. H3M3-2]|uniref:hypothetical protein n=1 Tax=Roseisolibacter sp. H3M3-2 TaxID=3031323 RepID=UPI0023DA56A1|nr:hypothetical protein [Roseisolibacter sp. H3M3-2]MDF1505615.1 hypothetical protein [Roseisolibacter sp. H3M3-2]